MMRRLLSDRTASSAAEFAMVLPLLILFLFGIIDGGRYLWEVNKAEKATQAGARVMIVTDSASGGLAAHSYLGDTSGGAALTQGDLVPAAALGEARCTSSGGTVNCTCVATPCPTLTPYINTGYSEMLARMRAMKPDIAEQNVNVTYRGSGLGFAGDPNGMDISPLVTVELSGVQFRPLVLFNSVALNLPAFRTTLTSEDSSGSVSN